MPLLPAVVALNGGATTPGGRGGDCEGGFWFPLLPPGPPIFGTAFSAAVPAGLGGSGAGPGQGELLHLGDDHLGHRLRGALQLPGVQGVLDLASVALQPVEGALGDAPLEDVSLQCPADLRAQRLEGLLRDLAADHGLHVPAAELAQNVEGGVGAAVGDELEVEVVREGLGGVLGVGDLQEVPCILHEGWISLRHKAGP